MNSLRKTDGGCRVGGRRGDGTQRGSAIARAAAAGSFDGEFVCHGSRRLGDAADPAPPLRRPGRARHGRPADLAALLPRPAGAGPQQPEQRIRRREDEEDVLQSMYKSFCLRQQRGEFDLAGRDALWKLLVTITLRKARNAAKRQGREKRDVAREQTIAIDDETRSAHWVLEQMDAAGPSPAEAAVLNEALERRLEALADPELRQIALWRLEGYTNREIADRLDCTERSVERRMERIRSKWMSYDDGGSDRRVGATHQHHILGGLYPPSEVCHGRNPDGGLDLDRRGRRPLRTGMEERHPAADRTLPGRRGRIAVAAAPGRAAAGRARAPPAGGRRARCRRSIAAGSRTAPR